MWLSEITVQQHLKEMQQAAHMHRMALELRQPANSPRQWLTRLFAFMHRRRQPEVVALTVLPPAVSSRSDAKTTTTLRRAS